MQVRVSLRACRGSAGLRDCPADSHAQGFSVAKVGCEKLAFQCKFATANRSSSSWT